MRTLSCDLRWTRWISSAYLFRCDAQIKSSSIIPKVTQFFPCRATNIDKAMSHVISPSSPVCIRIDMVPILQMGHGNCISFIQGLEPPSTTGYRSSMHNATVPLRGGSVEAPHSSETAHQHACQTRQQSKEQAFQPAEVEKQTKTI